MNIQTDTNKEIERRNAALNSMAKVMELPSGSPERWRATFLHFLRQRPEAAAEAHYIAQQVRENRKAMDKFASTQHGRMTMSTPSWLMEVVKSTDPDYFIGKTAKDLISPKHLTKLKRAFPEFFYPEVI